MSLTNFMHSWVEHEQVFKIAEAISYIVATHKSISGNWAIATDIVNHIFKAKCCELVSGMFIYKIWFWDHNTGVILVLMKNFEPQR